MGDYRGFIEPTLENVRQLNEDGQIFLTSVYTDDGKGIRGMVRVWVWEQDTPMYDDCYIVQTWSSQNGNGKPTTFYVWSGAVVDAWREGLDALIDA